MGKRNNIPLPKRLLYDAAWILGIACTVRTSIYIWAYGFGIDAHAYWQAWHGPMYTTEPMTRDAYLYSPAFAHILWPLAQLPWPMFFAVFTVGLAIALAWLLKPLGWRWAFPLWLAGLPEITFGNISILLAVAAALGFSKPQFWAFAALTKVSPCVGPIWFLVRREWRNLLLVLITIMFVAFLSAAFAASLWKDWFHFLLEHLSESNKPLGSSFLPPAMVRIPIGVGLVSWAALKEKHWVVPIAMFLCSPVLWVGSFTLLAAIPRIQMARHTSGCVSTTLGSTKTHL